MSIEINIQVEYRPPQTKHEKKVFGHTQFRKNGDIAHIFINSQRSKRDGEALNTFFHELTHVWNEMLGAAKVSQRDNEHSAALVGDTVEALIKRYFRR